jgi:hypothetical protein
MLAAGDVVMTAHMARAIAIVRQQNLVAELLRPGTELTFIEALREALGPNPSPTVPLAQRILARLRDDEKPRARALAASVFTPNTPIDVAGCISAMTRTTDRLTLVLSGSLFATLAAGPLPTILEEPAQRAQLLLTGSARALELAAFAARDNAWTVRRMLSLA